MASKQSVYSYWKSEQMNLWYRIKALEPKLSKGHQVQKEYDGLFREYFVLTASRLHALKEGKV